MIGLSQKKKLKLWEKFLCEDVMHPLSPTHIGEKGRALGQMTRDKNGGLLTHDKSACVSQG